MRVRYLGSSVLSVGLLAAGIASAAGFERTEANQFSIFIPNGFDDNDEVNIVIDGYLPSSCYKLDDLNYQIDHENHAITVQQLARKYEGPCLAVLVPFTNVLRIPALPYGDYTVTGSQGAIETKLHISEATNAGPDDHLYAPIESVQINQDPGSSRRYAVLEGRFTNSCMEWDDIKAIDSGRSIEVLPIIKMQNRADCLEVDTWFKTTVDLPKKPEMGRYLLHVRSLNGRSENRMFSVGPELYLP